MTRRLKKQLRKLRKKNEGASPEQLWRNEIEAARLILVDQLRTLKDAPSGKMASSKQRALLSNDHARLWAAAKSCGHDLADKEFILATMREMDPFNLPTAPIEWHEKPKSSGGIRPICTLSPTMLATHYLIACLIDAQSSYHPNYFGVKKSGRDQAIEQARKWIEEGFCLLWHIDVVNCFASINSDALYQSPLPRRVIENQLITDNLNFRKTKPPEGEYTFCPYRDDIDSTCGPTGLLQGSPVSNAVLARIMTEVLYHLPLSENVQVLIATDNILVLARNQQALQEMTKTLTDTFRRLPFGPLELSPPIELTAGQLDFLGYSIDVQSQRIGISHKALTKLETRLEIAKRMDRAEASPIPKNMFRSLEYFRSGFRSAEDQSDVLAPYLDEIALFARNSGDGCAWEIALHYRHGSTIATDLLRRYCRE